MASKTESRRIDVFINDKTAGNSLRALQAEARKLRNEIRGLDPATDQFIQKTKELQGVQTRINGVNDKIKGLSGGMGNLLKSLSPIGPAMIAAFATGAVIAGIRSAITTIIEFQQANAKLQAITGATSSELKELKNQAQALGASTKYTAAEVTGLQIEYAKLGFTKHQIQDVTEATLNLATAADTDLANAATVAGSTLRIFGLDANQMHQVVDVMALSFSSSALDIEKFTESMKYVGPIAKAAGIDLETTTALIGELANNGINGSMAGTSLKEILSEMATEGSKLSDKLGFAVKNSDDLTRAFQILSKEGIDLAQAEELVGRQSKAAFLTLIAGRQNVEDLALAFDHAGGTAQIMADVQLNTLQGSISNLESAWDGLVLGIESGDGAMAKMAKGVVDLATSFLGLLTPGKTITELFFDQVNAVNNLETQTVPLINRYEELENKTVRTVEEQKEMDTILKQLIQQVPRSSLVFDEYGKVIGLNTDASRAWVEQQKEILKLKNKEAIEEQKDALIEYQGQLDRVVKLIEQHEKGGLIGSITLPDIGKVDLDAAGAQAKIDTYYKAVYTKMQSSLSELEKLGVDVDSSQEEVVNKIFGIFEQGQSKTIAEYTELTGFISVKNKELANQQHELTQEEINAQKAREEQLKADRAKELDEHKKQSKAYKDEEDKLQDEIQKQRDAIKVQKLAEDEAEIEKISQKYARLIEKAIGHDQAIRDLEVLREQEIALKKEEQRLQQEKEDEDLHIEKIKFLNDISEISANADEQELIANANKYQELFRQAEKFHVDIKVLEDSFAITQEKIRQKIAEKKAKEEEKRQQERIEADKAEYEARMQIARGFYDFARNLNVLFGEDNRTMVAIQKAAVVAQAAIDSASAISSLTKASEANPANAVTGGAAGVAQWIAGIARISTNIATVHKTLQTAKAPPAFANGGFTTPSFVNGGWVSNGTLGLIGEAGTEHVTPNWMVTSPMWADTISQLEYARMNNIGRYEDGGLTSNSTVPTTIPVNTQNQNSTQLNDMILMLNQSINTLNSRLSQPIRAVAVIDQDGVYDLGTAIAENESLAATAGIKGS